MFQNTCKSILGVITCLAVVLGFLGSVGGAYLSGIFCFWLGFLRDSYFFEYIDLTLELLNVGHWQIIMIKIFHCHPGMRQIVLLEIADDIQLLLQVAMLGDIASTKGSLQYLSGKLVQILLHDFIRLFGHIFNLAL
jgi:hypothetical protein